MKRHVLAFPPMADPDFNLLVALDALLAEGSVVKAARRLGLSDSAMSRTLARLRDATGDPLLVRAGRGLVPTPRAIQLRDRVRDLADEVRAVLRPAAAIDIAGLERTFTLRASESFIEVFAARLVSRVTAEAPGVLLRFAPRTDRDAQALRDGRIDLEIGAHAETAPELKVQKLLGDRLVDVRDVDLTTCGMVLEKNGEIAATGAGAAAMGHPANAVAWLANTLGAHGIALEAGEVVLSGSLGIMVPVKAGDNLRVTIGGIGGCSVRFV